MSGLEQERRMAVERFVCRENIARFSRLLTTNPNERERGMLSILISKEQEKQIRLSTHAPIDINPLITGATSPYFTFDEPTSCISYRLETEKPHFTE